MRTIRVLYLEQDNGTYLAHLEMNGGFKVEATSLERSDVWDGMYKASQVGRDLARRATPEQYDLVVIGNNRGTGVEYARLLLHDIKSRVLVVWNDYRPGDEEIYASLGLEHFCSRPEQADYLLKMLGEGEWHLEGYDTFDGEPYRLEGHYVNEAAATRAAQECLAKLEEDQPSESSGGRDGIQDRVFIVRPDGSKYLFAG